MVVCPRCKIELSAGEAAGITMHACERCGGLWLYRSSAQRVCAALPEEAIAFAREASEAGRDLDTRPAIRCPVCSKIARRLRTSAQGIEIDECEQHGTWFDRGELEIIAEALRQKRAGSVAIGSVSGASIAAMSGAVAVAAAPERTGWGEVVSGAVEVGGAAAEGAVAVGDGAAAVGGVLYVAEGVGLVAGGIFALIKALLGQ